MHTFIRGGVLLACFCFASQPAAFAQLIAQWNFNSPVPDASSGTGSFSPSTGSGGASLIGGVSGSFATGSPRDGASDNTAWSLTGWPAQGTASGTAGAQFLVSTAGFGGTLQISFDLRQTTTASERFQLQATSDGVTFTNVSGGVASVGAVGNNTATSFDSTGLFENTAANGSQAFVQAITYTFAEGGPYENNALFGFRLVSIFEGTQYDAAGASANYGTSGTIRLDLVSVNALPRATPPDGGVVAAVPEPATLATGLGLLALAVLARRVSRTHEKTPSA